MSLPVARFSCVRHVHGLSALAALFASICRSFHEVLGIVLAFGSGSTAGRFLHRQCGRVAYAGGCLAAQVLGSSCKALFSFPVLLLDSFMAQSLLIAAKGCVSLPVPDSFLWENCIKTELENLSFSGLACVIVVDILLAIGFGSRLIPLSNTVQCTKSAGWVGACLLWRTSQS